MLTRLSDRTGKIYRHTLFVRRNYSYLLSYSSHSRVKLLLTTVDIPATTKGSTATNQSSKAVMYTARRSLTSNDIRLANLQVSLSTVTSTPFPRYIRYSKAGKTHRSSCYCTFSAHRHTVSRFLVIHCSKLESCQNTHRSSCYRFLLTSTGFV